MANKGLITVSIMLATIMQVLDTTIANVALPNMQGSLGAAQDQITWVLTSYIVAAAIMTPVTGWLSDRFGLRELFIVSTAGFVVASMACGFATSLEEMILFRVLQGLFGAALVPLSQTVLLDINPKEEHGRAMAIWGAGIMVGPIIGPTLGGWLTETFNWRFVFFVNLPVGILALAGLIAFLPKSPRRARSFDFFGFAMLSIAIGALQLMLDRGEQVDWFSSAETWIYLGLVISGFWAFVLHVTSGREHPFMEPAMFADSNFVTALVLIFMVGVILLAGLALLPPMLQNLFGYPVVTTGMVLAPRGVGTMISMIVVGRLVGTRRRPAPDPRRPVADRLLALADDRLLARRWTGGRSSSRASCRASASASSSCRSRRSPSRRWSRGSAPRPRRCSAWCATSARRSASRSSRPCSPTTWWRRGATWSRSSRPTTRTSTRCSASSTDITATLAQLNAQVQAQAAMIAYVDDFMLMILADAGGDPADPAAAQAGHARRRRPRRRRDGVSVRLLRRFL